MFLISLRFSTNFQKFSNSPLLLEMEFCTGVPGKNENIAMWPLGTVAGAADEIPVSSGEGVGRGSRGEGLGLARDRLEPELGVEVAGGGARGGAQRRHPQRDKLQHGVRRGGAVRGGGSSSGS
jgi:hypothetical protein